MQDYGPYASTCGYCKHAAETSESHGKRSHGKPLLAPAQSPLRTAAAARARRRCR